MIDNKLDCLLCNCDLVVLQSLKKIKDKLKEKKLQLTHTHIHIHKMNQMRTK